MGFRRRHSAFVAAALVLVQSAAAHAGCDLIPQAQPIFRGTLGILDRPFAGPGDFVELHVRPAVCDEASPGLGLDVDDLTVTLVFEPLVGPPRVVVLTTATCDDPALVTRLDACAATPGPRPERVTCVQMNAATAVDMAIVTRADGLPRLRFRFPDTDALLGAPDDARTLAGPATIAVSHRAAPLPCALIAASCESRAVALGLTACVDELFARDGTCDPTPDPTFTHFTALPPPSDYQATCVAERPPCEAVAEETRLTMDRAGNLLAPVYWQGVLVRDGDQPVPRLLRATLVPPVPVTIPAATFLTSLTYEGQRLPPIFEPQSDPETLAPGALAFYGSVDVRATVLRVARRRGVCRGGAEDGASCASTLDCNGSQCVDACVGGSRDGLDCSDDGDCPQDGRCGVLYDAAAFAALAPDGGPIVLPRAHPGADGICELPEHAACSADAECGGDACVLYALAAEQAVSLDSLTSKTAALLVLTASEGVDGLDRNGDGDSHDVTVTLRARRTGRTLPLGAPPGFTAEGEFSPTCGIAGVPPGRAVVSHVAGAFTLPAVAFEGDTMAFLESEAGERQCDENADGDADDAILRAFTAAGEEASLALDPPRAVDPAPLVNGRGVAVSAGRVFFRSSELAGAPRRTRRVSVATLTGAEGNGASYAGADLSADGRVVAFASAAANLTIAPDTNGVPDVFVRDRVAGTTERVSVRADGSASVGPGADAEVSLSGDGRLVAFASFNDDLVPGDSNACPGAAAPCADVFVHDRVHGTTERVSVGPAGVQANGDSGHPVISDDGRFVAFTSAATNLLGAGGDTNGITDVFVRDRCVAGGAPVPGCVPRTERVSVTDDERQASGTEGGRRRLDMSADGRIVAFDMPATNLPSGAGTSHVSGVFVRDRVAGTTEQVPFRTQRALAPSLSADGRFVAYQLGRDDDARTVGPLHDLVVYDRATRRLEVASVRPDGEPASDGASFAPSLSADGRFVLFASDSAALLGPGADTNGARDLFVRDRQLAVTRRVAVEPAPTPGKADAAPWGRLGRDGRSALFVSASPHLLGPSGDTNGVLDVFLDGVAEPVGGLDLFADGVLDDVVLEVLAAAPAPGGALPGAVTTLCPAEQVAVASGRAAFLRPEAAVGTTTCPGGSLNGDLDVADLVVHLWPGSGPARSLGRAATAVALGPSRVAAIVSEAGEGADLNGDGDATDGVVQLRDFDDGTWVSLAQAADTIAFCGAALAFVTPEEAHGGADLNGDGDAADRVLRVHVPATGVTLDLGQAVEEFVCSERILAFRTSEAAQGGVDLQGGGAAPPLPPTAVMQTYDLGRPECLTAAAPADCLRNTGQAATPCAAAACDPRAPYKVSGCHVRFLTQECEQRGAVDPDRCGSAGGTDLNGDEPPDADDLVIQLVDACAGPRTVLGTVGGDANPFQGADDAADGSGSTIFVASGRCVETLGACTDDADCALGAACRDGACRRGHRTCVTALDCPPGAACVTGPFGTILAASPDTDDDGVPDHLDNCPYARNPGQEDLDGDDTGDACDRRCDVCVRPPPGHLMCYGTRIPPTGTPDVDAALVDRFGPARVRIAEPRRVCAPAVLAADAVPPSADTAHALGYRLRKAGLVPDLPRGLRVVNELGSLTVDLVRPDLLLVPSAASLDGPPQPLATAAGDRLRCYRVGRARARVAGLPIVDTLGALRVDLKRPRRLCVPADADGVVADPAQALLCYEARVSNVARPFVGPRRLFVTNEFGSAGLDLARLRPVELCVPSALE